MTSHSRCRGARAGGTWLRSWPRPGSRRIWPSRPAPRHGGGGNGTPRPVRPTRGTCGCCWPRAGCRSAGFPPGHVLECRALLELSSDLRRERTAWAQRIHAVLFHQGAPVLGEGALRTEKGVAELRAAAAAHLSAAGQLQVATALEVIDGLEDRLHLVRHQLLDAARHLAGAKALAARLYGVGPVTTVSSSDRKGPPGKLSRQGPPVLRWAVYEAGKTHARTSAPDHRYYAAVKDRKNSKRACLSEARKILRQAHHILAELGDDALAAA